jgi:hypothetical protein
MSRNRAAASDLSSEELAGTGLETKLPLSNPFVG